jgi:hypothetical protein
MGGSQDRGDVAGVPGWTLELKATQRIALAEALTEAKVEAAHAGTLDYAAIIKRRNHPVASAYVVMPLDGFVHLLNRSQGSAASSAGVTINMGPPPDPGVRFVPVPMEPGIRVRA